MPPELEEDAKYLFSTTFTDPQTIPYEGLSEAVSEAMRRQKGADLALYPPPQGHEALRELIAANLSEKRGVDTTPESIFLSSGAGGAVQTILDAFIDPGDVVLAEEFVYMGTLKQLVERGAHVVHVATDGQGMDTAALESILRSLASEGKRLKLIYSISVYQNPMGVTLSEERRERLIELSQEFGVPILENESYADFRIDGDPLPPAMIGMDGQDSVMYVSAYTKLLGCGLRLGYGVVPDEVQETLAKMSFGTSPSYLSSMAVYEFMRRHGDEHIEKVRASLKGKRDAMLRALGDHFPDGCRWSSPAGGMMLWVRLPDGADTWSVLGAALAADVKFNPGPQFRAGRDRPNYLRLTYSYNTPEEITEGVAILADLFRRKGFF
ncbi:MAG: PLP-dependent aminotransferase family protein [Chloroflexi bacterium]|nr:PLP-dependent aminotransferase family protein [Chloroflexota bacterium]